jgi:hypothetical protein
VPTPPPSVSFALRPRCVGCPPGCWTVSLACAPCASCVSLALVGTTALSWCGVWSPRPRTWSGNLLLPVPPLLPLRVPVERTRPQAVSQAVSLVVSLVVSLAAPSQRPPAGALPPPRCGVGVEGPLRARGVRGRARPVWLLPGPPLLLGQVCAMGSLPCTPGAVARGRISCELGGGVLWKAPAGTWSGWVGAAASACLPLSP